MITLAPNPKADRTSNRRSFVPFSLHGAAYDPPGPTMAPPPASAPIIVVPVPTPPHSPHAANPNNNLQRPHVFAGDNDGGDLLPARPAQQLPRRRSFFGGEGVLPLPLTPSVTGSALGLGSGSGSGQSHGTGMGTGMGMGIGQGTGTGTGPALRSARATSVQVVQAELDETVAIMRGNLQALAERGERLGDLESRTENLVVAARGFRRSAHKVRKDMWWKDMKMRLIIGLAISVVIALTVLSIVQAVRKTRPKTQVKRDDVYGQGMTVARGVEARGVEAEAVEERWGGGVEVEVDVE